MVRSYCFAYLPAILGTIAIVCGTAANIYCETLEFPQNGTGATLFAGIWGYRTRDYIEIGNEVWAVTVCRSYRYLDREFGFDYDLDAEARTAMAFSIIAPVIGGLALFYSYAAACTGGEWLKKGWRPIGNAFILTCSLQGLTLISQSSSICRDNPTLQFLDALFPVIRQTFPEECQWGPGYRLGISSVVLWFIAGLSTYFIQAPELSASEPQQSQTVTYQRNADGTVEESNVVVVKGAEVQEQPVAATAQYENDGKGDVEK